MWKPWLGKQPPLFGDGQRVAKSSMAEGKQFCKNRMKCEFRYLLDDCQKWHNIRMGLSRLINSEDTDLR